MNDGGDPPSPLGKRLLDGGWRQCSLIKPDQAHAEVIPTRLGFDPTRERMMLVTQSCSICGIGRNNEQFVEAMAVELLPSITKDHGQARHGRNTRDLVLALSNFPGHEGIRCDIDRRCFLPRELLESWEREGAIFAPDELAIFQGWMARYYVRVAVPTELVERFKRSGFQAAMKKALERRFTADGSGPRMHEVIDRIFVRWSPNEELPAGADYDVSLIVACDFDYEHMVEEVDQRILAVPQFSNGDLASQGVLMSEPQVTWIGNLTHAATRGYQRLGDWDALTGLDDYAEAVRGD